MATANKSPNKRVSSDRTIASWKWGNNPPTFDSPPTPDTLWVPRKLSDGRDEYTSTRAFLFGNYNKSITAYESLVEEALADFPGLKRSEIECGMVTESNCQKYFALITFSLPNGTRRDGYYHTDRPIDFNWR